MTRLLSEVLGGHRRRGIVHYPCHSPGIRRWFVAMIDRLPRFGDVDEAHALITHLDLFDLGYLPEAPDGVDADLRRLLSMTAHDLQSPLRTLTAIISEDIPITDEEWQKLRPGVISRLAHCQALLRELIDFVRIGQIQPQITDFSLDALTAESIALADVPDVARVQADTTGLQLHSDRGALGHVLVNLIRNAIEHNDKAEPVVEIAVEALADGVQISVSDNGPGVPVEAREALFEIRRPKQGAKAGGLGVALSLCKQTIERFGGQLRVEDSALGGARFSFSFRA